MLPQQEVYGKGPLEVGRWIWFSILQSSVALRDLRCLRGESVLRDTSAALSVLRVESGRSACRHVSRARRPRHWESRPRHYESQIPPSPLIGGMGQQRNQRRRQFFLQRHINITNTSIRRGARPLDKRVCSCMITVAPVEEPTYSRCVAIPRSPKTAVGPPQNGATPPVTSGFAEHREPAARRARTQARLPLCRYCASFDNMATSCISILPIDAPVLTLSSLRNAGLEVGGAGSIPAAIRSAIATSPGTGTYGVMLAEKVCDRSH